MQKRAAWKFSNSHQFKKISNSHQFKKFSNSLILDKKETHRMVILQFSLIQKNSLIDFPFGRRAKPSLILDKKRNAPHGNSPILNNSKNSLLLINSKNSLIL